ncbi:tRNA pseudouridine(38-40) synthase TruA [Novisyntrophococcus fermenticellae]|uniref:tRNA pseudouridine(38-40) synthase TruA n=1 Tax=Novisyntrophococcus fermenticellae TaxID=2068655 RepID=UPI001E5D5D34|nr:tRNA pseudouridine(38-40) synthase TruA [Novisyntrophococcus fermenticellae]
MNYRMVLQYDGSRYDGWQKQGNTGNTIQGKLEAVLSRFAGESVEVNGAGRTDAGVHAYGQTASFHLKQEAEEEELWKYLNRYLPEDIEVLGVERAPERFHARLSAVRKTYMYKVGLDSRKHVFDRKYLYHFEGELDIKAMEEAARYLRGTHDFKSFCSNRRFKKSTIRTLHMIKIDLDKKTDVMKIIFIGDGFLYHMVRIITGTLLEVGQGKRSPSEIKGIIEAKDREAAGFTAPPQGLTLVSVEYE